MGSAPFIFLDFDGQFKIDYKLRPMWQRRASAAQTLVEQSWVSMRRSLLTVCIWTAVCGGAPCWAVNGNSLALNSGTDSGSSALLANNGYAGTYITLASPGDVTVTVNASGVAANSIDPHMNIVIDDALAGFDVGSTAQNYAHTFSLPAGTHFIRTEMNNDPAQPSRSLRSTV